MKRIRVVLLVLLLILLSCVCSYAASTAEIQCADALYKLGLFKGTGVKADGTPEYSLDIAPTRAEAITMLVRLLGKEAEAKAQEWTTPFTDVEDWAKPYVGYAYNNELTTGTGTTTFGGNEKVSETQYLTFILRTLGYSDKNGDFSWDKARLLTDKIEITNVDYRLRSFTRGNLAEVSFKALSSQMKDSVATLIDTLYIEGSVTKEKVANVGLSLTSDDVLNAPKNNYKKGDVVRFNDMRFTYGENPVGFYLNEYMGNEKRLEIPETVNGIPVVGITYHIGNISEVVIPRTVSFINYEFEYPSSISYIEVDSRNTSFVVKDNCLLSYDGTICYMVCGGLTDHLIIPEGVKTIGCALSVKAETISLPSSLEVLGRYEESFHTNSALNNQTTAFIVDKDCKYFSSIDGVLFNKDASVLYSYPGANEAEEYTIPSTVKEIYKYAFRNCMNLKQINIPQSVDTVYRGAIQIDDKDYKVVCCEVSKKPSGWDSEWYLECDSSSIKNISQGEYVHWGYKF